MRARRADRLSRCRLECERLGSGKTLVFPPGDGTIGDLGWGVLVVEWRIKLEARSGWGEVETIEVAQIKRRVVG